MAKYIRATCFSCGKEFSKPYVVSDNLVSSDSTCFSCQRLLSATAAKDYAKKLMMPELKGSEKQVLWAEPIRMKVVNELLVRLHDFWDDKSQFIQAKKILIHILGRSDLLRAGFWIENRYNEYGAKNYILKLANEEINKINPILQWSSSKQEPLF